MSDDPQDPFDDPFKRFFGGRNPFDLGNMDEFFRSMGIDPIEFQRLFEDMQRNLQEAFKNMGDDPSKGFVQGFSFRMGPDGKPQFSSFGNKPAVKTGEGMPRITADEWEPLTDVIKDDLSVSVTMELPGVDKSDINLHMTEDSLEISVDNERRKVHKRIPLPAKVDPKTTKATYKNGVLDVSVQRKEPHEEGLRIDVE